MGNWLTANKEALPSPIALVLLLFDFPLSRCPHQDIGVII
ncbi:hypothetical protein CsSME_00004439 [Camellia sinensis var. sinensis]